MPLFVSLLRGVNVSGKNRLAMADLKAVYADLGFSDIQTYLQSGNVVCSGKLPDPKAVSKALLKSCQVEAPVLILPAAAFLKIAEAKPLSSSDPAFWHVTFLFGKPTKAFPQAPPLHGDEQAILAQGQVYLSCPHGYGRSKLTTTYWEKALGVPATTRNWKTVQALRQWLAS